ncbi:Uncharacterized protein OBRU01_17456 [Operophtera brumata]|uniref:Thioredoxin domain-containing protein n=1 Tax=Operophtera brumata TaxID=104452 RepID=A0A0L7L0H7_OPEBR|nr:Uncharacterized protein OBRU01_17456 [Operophtera brumata]
MDCKIFWKILLPMLIVLAQISVLAKKQKTSVVTDISDIKEFKKLLRTKTNVMILFINEPNEGKKLCKKLKIASQKPYYMKHYKDGEFHKDYDRSETQTSMSNFLRDPTGDLPWEEDPSATDIYHLIDGEALSKFLKKGAAGYKKSMIMFYAPWCGFCKTMKPEYVQAAVDLKGEALLAAIDVAKPGNSKIRQIYNITGFPTLYYYEKGQFRFPYNGDNKRQAMVDFMRDPTAQIQSKKKELDESWRKFRQCAFKSRTRVGGLLRALVWPLQTNQTRLKGVLAAVDATKHPDLGSRFGVKGYPTLKYFNKGEFKYDAGHARQEEQIVSFIKPWAEEPSAVRHLDAATFRHALRKIKHAVVMFYAPWCGHCKSTKPEFVRAAERFADELMVAFGAVDCTAAQDLCGTYDVRGYPTIKYFSYFDKQIADYTGGRKEADFVSFIHTQMEHQTSQNQAKTAQEAGFGGNVQLAFDSDFEQVIASPKPTFVIKVCTALKGGPINAIAVDAAENPKVADIGGIQTLPTFKLFANGKVIAEYEGDRSEGDMLSFCKSHAKVKDEL